MEYRITEVKGLKRVVKSVTRLKVMNIQYPKFDEDFVTTDTNQEISGKKTFKDDIHVINLYPEKGRVTNIGTKSISFTNVYAKNVYSQLLGSDSDPITSLNTESVSWYDDNGNIVGIIEKNDGDTNEIKIFGRDEIVFCTTDSTGNVFRVIRNAIVPSKNESIDLGKNEYRWNSVYTTTIMASSSITTPSASVTDLAVTNVTVSGTFRAGSIGTSSQPVTTAHIRSLSVTESASAPAIVANAVTAGTITSTGSVTATKINGELPSPTGSPTQTPTLEVGSIVLAKVMGLNASFSTGETYTFPGEGYNLRFTTLSGDEATVFGSRDLPDGKYKFLSDVGPDGSKRVCLVMYLGIAF